MSLMHKEDELPPKYDTENEKLCVAHTQEMQSNRRFVIYTIGLIVVLVCVLINYNVMMKREWSPVQVFVNVQIPNSRDYDDSTNGQSDSTKYPQHGNLNCERKKQVASVCNSTFGWQELSNVNFDNIQRNIHIDEDRKIIFCYGVKEMGYPMRSQIVNETKRGIREKYWLQRIQSDDYLKIIVARHPFDRFTRAYITNQQNNNGRNKSLLRADDSFKRITEKVTDIAKDGENIPADFKTLQETCFPCAIKYDFIIKDETRFTDLQKLNHSYIGLSDEQYEYVDSVLFSIANYPPIDPMSLKQYIAGLRGKSFEKLINYYAVDLEMFGYDWRFETDGISLTYCAKHCLQNECC